ncbi:MAG: MASE3 domain-containing protein [Caulobacteraceae bacterium]
MESKYVRQNYINFDRILLRFLLAVSLNALIALLLSFRASNEKNLIFHAIAELTCVFIAISAFVIVWSTHARGNIRDHLVGYGFLAISIFELLHTFYILPIGAYSQSNREIASEFCIASKVTEAVVLFSVSIHGMKIKINRWAGLIFAMLYSALIAAFILVIPDTFRSISTTRIYTNAKITIECGVIAILLAGLYNFRKINIEEKGMIDYKYVLLSILIAIPTELFHIIFQLFHPFTNAFAHVLKVTFYYFLFRGVVLNAINYPYYKLEEVWSHNERILNSLPLGVATFDEGNRVNFINKRAEELTGYSKESLYGLTIEESTYKFIGLDMVADSPYSKVAEGLCQNIDINTEYYDVNSSKIKICVNLSKLDKGILVIFNDIKKEQELANIKLQTRAILDAFDQPVFVYDKSGKISAYNNYFKEMLEIDDLDIQDSDINMLHNFLSILCINRVSKAAVAGKKSIEYEVSYKTHRGNIKDVSVKVYSVQNIDEECIGWIGIGTDIEKVRAEQQRIFQQEKLALIGQMAAGIVHEIKNPLATIKGFNQIIKSKVQDEKIKSYTQTVEDAINDVSRVANEFLSFAKPKQTIVKELYINSLIDSMQLMICSHTFRQGIKTGFFPSEKEAPVVADEGQIKQVVLNLCENAIDALSGVENPVLNIYTEYKASAKEISIIVEDNGKGMSPEVARKIGSPFFTTKEKGTGLGLNVCYQIINAHNGRIEVRSEPEKGTRFTVVLPCKKQI